jgi:hypothetical protein
VCRLTNGQNRGGSVVDLKRVGRIELRNVNAISEFYGRDFIPYPFMVRDPVRSALQAEAADSAPDRFNHGDLRIFKQWFTTYMTAAIRVECNVQYLGVDTPSLRILAHRSGEFGFLATQHVDDAIEVFALSPYELGAAVAGSVKPTKPGKHAKIVIPEYIPRRSPADDGGARHAVSVPVVTSATAMKVPESTVTVYATIQTHWRPARDWGFDHTKDAVVWVRVSDDGEYIYVPDYSHAKPMTGRGLRDGIDRLIGQDVASLKKLEDG